MSPATAFIPYLLLPNPPSGRDRATTDQHNLIAGGNDFAALLHSTLLGQPATPPEAPVRFAEAQGECSQASADAVSPIGKAGKPPQPTGLHRAVEGETVAAGVRYLAARFPGSAASSLLRPSPSSAQMSALAPVPSLPIAVSPPLGPARRAGSAPIPANAPDRTAAFAPFPELTARGTGTGLVEPTTSVPWRGRLIPPLGREDALACARRPKSAPGWREMGQVRSSRLGAQGLTRRLLASPGQPRPSPTASGGARALGGVTEGSPGVTGVPSADSLVALRVLRTPVPPSLQDVESDVELPQGDAPLTPAARAVIEQAMSRALDHTVATAGWSGRLGPSIVHAPVARPTTSVGETTVLASPQVSARAVPTDSGGVSGESVSVVGRSGFSARLVGAVLGRDGQETRDVRADGEPVESPTLAARSEMPAAARPTSADKSPSAEGPQMRAGDAPSAVRSLELSLASSRPAPTWTLTGVSGTGPRTASPHDVSAVVQGPRASAARRDVSAAAGGPHKGAEAVSLPVALAKGQAKAAEAGPFPSTWGHGAGRGHPQTVATRIRVLPPSASSSSPVARTPRVKDAGQLTEAREVADAGPLIEAPPAKPAVRERFASAPASSEAVAELMPSPSRATETSAPVRAVRIPEIAASSVPAEGEVKHLRLEVHPPELGACELELAMHRHALHALVLVERPETVAVLRDAEAQIREALLDQGIQVAAFDVQQGAAGGPGHFTAGAQRSAALAPAAVGLAAAARDPAPLGGTALRQASRPPIGTVDVLA